MAMKTFAQTASAHQLWKRTSSASSSKRLTANAPNSNGLPRFRSRASANPTTLPDSPYSLPPTSPLGSQEPQSPWTAASLRHNPMKPNKHMPKLSSKSLKFARDRLKQSRVPALLGFHVEKLARGRATLSMEVKDLHKQVHDVVHGGVIAVYTVVPVGAEIATVELKINYLSAVPGWKIKAIGEVLRAGRNFVIAECEVIDAKGKLAAKALMTFGAVAGTTLEQAASSSKN